MANDIDCSDTVNWNEGGCSEVWCQNDIGFITIGHEGYPFTGNFSGNNHTISNLFINRGQQDAGLFGFASDARISDVGLINVNVSGPQYAGSLIGDSSGNYIDNCFATGNVNGGTLGGLVGNADAIVINNSYSACDVIGSGYAGGLVGYVGFGSIENSYATGYVSGDYTGGLVGTIDGDIYNSYATGNTTGGGLVGMFNSGTIANSYSTGCCGGLIGSNADGTIENIFFYKSVDNPNDCYLLSCQNIVSEEECLLTEGCYWEGSCYGDYVGPDCTPIYAESYFFNVNNPPMNIWSFPPWDSLCDKSNYPPLAWQGIDSECYVSSSSSSSRASSSSSIPYAEELENAGPAIVIPISPTTSLAPSGFGTSSTTPSSPNGILDFFSGMVHWFLGLLGH